METDYRKENIKKNVKIIVWIIIAINAYGIYKSFGHSFDGFSIQNVNGANNITEGIGLPYFAGFPIIWGVFSVLSLILSIAIVLFAAQALQFREKGRALLCNLLLAYIVFKLITYIFTIILMWRLNSGFGFGRLANVLLILALLITFLFNIAVVAANYMFYRYLNKPDTRAVFIEAMSNS